MKGTTLQLFNAQKHSPSTKGLFVGRRLLLINVMHLGSVNCARAMLRKKKRKEVEECKEILAAVRNPRLRSAALPAKPYSGDEEYRLALKKARIEGMARVLRMLSILMQTKVYLFWESSDYV